MLKIKRQLVKFHRLLCKELGITPVLAKDIICEADLGGQVGLAGVLQNGSPTIMLDLADCAEYGICPFIVMAHETYHIFQIRKRLFSKLGHRYLGRPLKHWESKVRKYHRLPWELDAIKYERKIAKTQGLKHPNPRKAALYMGRR